MTDTLTRQKPSTLPRVIYDSDQVDDYHRLTAAAGVDPTQATILRLRRFLDDHDIPVFNLPEVVRYLDDDARLHNPHRTGWVWRPISWRYSLDDAGCDFFNHDKLPMFARLRGLGYSDAYTSDGVGYGHIIPAPVLGKIAMIRQEFKPRVYFFISDHASPTPAPDPFLMVAVKNRELASGHGRFVIDVWDEPGFGLEQRL